MGLGLGLGLGLGFGLEGEPVTVLELTRGRRLDAGEQAHVLAEARLEQRRGVGDGGAAREVEDARAATWLGLG